MQPERPSSRKRELADLYSCGYAPPTRQRIVEALDGSEDALIQLRPQIQEDVTRKLVELLRKQDPLAIWNGIVNRMDWRTIIDPIHSNR